MGETMFPPWAPFFSRSLDRRALALPPGKARLRAQLLTPSQARQRGPCEGRILDEHPCSSDDHGPWARRHVLPDRIRPVADLRADGRAQLRTRRVSDRRCIRVLVAVA